MTRQLFLLFLISFIVVSCGEAQQQSGVQTVSTMSNPDSKNDSAWKAELEPMQYHVLREKGTERPYTGLYDKFFEPGMYHCAGCDNPLFASNTKFDSGCGWPAFFAPLIEDNMNIHIDRSHGMVREEVTCSNCGGHLGHVFNDGPAPTYRRYCINSAAMTFKPVNEK